jgi:ribosome-associated heat shock protein Hsp15
LRINGQKCKKPGHGVMVGDTLTFVQAESVRLIRVLNLSERRGPATEAQTLYLDLDAPPPTQPLESLS